MVTPIARRNSWFQKTRIQLTAFFALLSAAAASAGAISGAFDKIISTWKNTGTCAGIKGYPIGNWYLTEINAKAIPANQYNTVTRFDSDRSGIWFAGQGKVTTDGKYESYVESPVTLSGPLQPGKVLISTATAPGGYVVKITLQVSPDGCTMGGTYRSTINGQESDVGSVRFCYWQQKGCTDPSAQIPGVLPRGTKTEP
jgi:hypothetical protein